MVISYCTFFCHEKSWFAKLAFKILLEVHDKTMKIQLNLWNIQTFQPAKLPPYIERRCFNLIFCSNMLI